MTVVVAGVWGKKGVIAADSLVVSKDNKQKNIKNFQKLIKFPNFVVGFSGDCSIFPILNDFAKDKTYLRKAHLKMRSQKDALKFSMDIFEMLQGNLSCSPCFSPDDEDWAVELLVLAKNGSIFILEPLMSVTEVEDFESTGSGEDVAKGTMLSLYKRIKSEKDLVEFVTEACKNACEIKTDCQEPLQVIELDIIPIKEKTK